jgi:hypothetical protein
MELARDGKHLRLTATEGGNVIAQRFDGDPALGARYVGSTGFAAKTVAEVTAHYERMGWTRTTTPDTNETKADS